MRVQTVISEDIPAWLKLAAEVEFLFGPMVDERGFHAALTKNISRGSAFCVRVDDGSVGSELMGGLLFSCRPPIYRIGWLAVAKTWRRKGVATVLIDHVLPQIVPPANLMVTAFGTDNDAGAPARYFYEQMDFDFLEDTDPGPEGGSRVILRRAFV